MAKRNHTPTTSSTKYIRVGTSLYPAGVCFAERLVPYIRLRGDWLSNAGFSPDDVLAIRITRGRLVIRRA